VADQRAPGPKTPILPAVQAADTSAIVDLITDGTIDAELAATVWLLVDDRVPVIVAAADARDAAGALDAVVDLVGDGRHLAVLDGAGERFEWLPQAGELGMPRSRARGEGDVGRFADQDQPDQGRAVRPETTAIVARWIAPDGQGAVWGDAARIAVRAATIGYGLIAAVSATSLEGVLTTLGPGGVGLTDDERSRLGVVLVLGRDPGGRQEPTLRIRAAHYVRPTARDEHGHVQRLGPAVLATWDDELGRFEHFGWGITPELAHRVGRKPGDLEIEVDRRRALLDTLAVSRG